MDSIPGSGKSRGEGNRNQLQHSCLENFMDRRTWWAIVHGLERVGNHWATNTLIFIFTMLRENIKSSHKRICFNKDILIQGESQTFLCICPFLRKLCIMCSTKIRRQTKSKVENMGFRKQRILKGRCQLILKSQDRSFIADLERK